jgi:Tfp pilus assembly protein PilN
MRPLVNLASEPFRNRRLFWLVIVAVFASSSAVGFYTIRAISGLDHQVKSLEPIVKEQEERVKAMAEAGRGVSALTPEQNYALQAANVLIARKGFSWSQLLNDLERHVPATVRVVKISVNRVAPRAQTDPGGKSVSLSLLAVGRNASEVTQMIYGLNKSGAFSAEPRVIAPVEGTEEVEFTLEVEYRPAVRASRSALANQIAEGKR